MFSINEIFAFFASINQNENYFYDTLTLITRSKYFAEFSNQEKCQEVLYLIYCYSLFSLVGAKIQNANVMVMQWNSDGKIRISIKLNKSLLKVALMKDFCKSNERFVKHKTRHALHFFSDDINLKKVIVH